MLGLKLVEKFLQQMDLNWKLKWDFESAMQKERAME
jgi:hypothetical protein